MCTGGLRLREERLRKQDSCWSNVVCLCATLSQAFIMGIAQGSFGILLPVIMEELDSSRGETGKYSLIYHLFLPFNVPYFLLFGRQGSCKTKTRKFQGHLWSHELGVAVSQVVVHRSDQRVRLALFAETLILPFSLFKQGWNGLGRLLKCH